MTQVVPVTALASPGKRLGGALLSVLLAIVTLGIGYLIWAMIAWGKSTTPAKQVLGMRVVDANTGQPLTWGGMFMRQFVFGMLVAGVASAVTFGVFGLVDALFCCNDRRQRVVDKMAGSLVINV